MEAKLISEQDSYRLKNDELTNLAIKVKEVIVAREIINDKKEEAEKAFVEARLELDLLKDQIL